MSSSPYYSHRKDDKENPLEKHLRGVAEKAENFATFHNSQNWAYLAGIWHDLGKYQQGFQDYLIKATAPEDAHIETENKTGGFLQKCPHSHAGAVHAQQKLGDIQSKILGYIIAGHHTGLPDGNGGGSSLSSRLQNDKAQIEYQNSIKENIPNEILNASRNRELEFPKFDNKNPLSLSIWIRMLFSCLVDSDFLDTEEFMSPDQLRRGEFPTLKALKEKFDKKIQTIQKTDTELNKLRTKIYNQCLEGAKQNHKFFSLTVPTGGGKTLASLGFALEHAKNHHKKRIIYAIPYTSIIEQNAEVFRKFLGEDSLIEHHSNLDETQKGDTETSRNRLAAENWDASLIVTTNVQLFESLFASRTSRCRKLHNLQDSIIILDEAQMLPRDFLTPITEAMKVLADEYNVTWLLCTATQPNLGKQTDGFNRTTFEGLNCYELMQGDIHPENLANQLKRVDITFKDEVIDYPTLAIEIVNKATIGNKSVLAIVNTRNDCRSLYNECKNKGFDDKNLYHLSALMCAEHRSDVIKRIKEDLKAEKTIIVISTQLVEAGVDLDFPVVYRAMTGLDSIAQAAGRCNREGRLDCLGEVVVFNPLKNNVMGILKEGLQITQSIFKKIKDKPLSPESFKLYFEKLYDNSDDKTVLDKKGILKSGGENSLRPDSLYNIKFRTVAQVFQLILEGEQISVIVPYKKENETESPIYQFLNVIKNKEHSNRWAYRKLQRYTVNLYKGIKLNDLIKNNIIKVDEFAGKYVLDAGYYKEFGLQFSDDELSIFDTVIG